MNPTLTWVHDINPIVSHDPDTGDRAEVRDARLTTGMQAAMEALVDSVDEGECASCESPIGYVLIEDDEHPALSRLTWMTTAAVERGSVVLLVCEECSPEVMYEVPEDPS